MDRVNFQALPIPIPTVVVRFDTRLPPVINVVFFHRRVNGRRAKARGPASGSATGWRSGSGTGETCRSGRQSRAFQARRGRSPGASQTARHHGRDPLGQRPRQRNRRSASATVSSKPPLTSARISWSPNPTPSFPCSNISSWKSISTTWWISRRSIVPSAPSVSTSSTSYIASRATNASG